MFDLCSQFSDPMSLVEKFGLVRNQLLEDAFLAERDILDDKKEQVSMASGNFGGGQVKET